MTTEINTPTQDELAKRIGRFANLEPMSTAKDLAWVPQGAMDIIFARTISPVVLDDTKNPFGNTAPIFGAAGTTMFISVMPPGQGPCLHSHNSTYETFMVLEGTIEYFIGDPVEHRVTLNKWDVFSCPPRVYRGFRNVGTGDAVQLTVITGIDENRDDVSMPNSVADQLRREYGEKVVDGFRSLFHFDPPRAQP
jgi:quercetin dioxygenase-like cupin family protein